MKPATWPAPVAPGGQLVQATDHMSARCARGIALVDDAEW
jgi:hypothetical protein